MIKLDAKIPTTTWGFYQFSIEVLTIVGMARIHRLDHSTLYKYARDPERVPDGEARQDPLRRLLIQCGDVVTMGGSRGKAAVRVVAQMVADLADCDVTPREPVCPDKGDVTAECLDDYPPLVRLHELIEKHAPNAAVKEQLRALIRELYETIVTYERDEAGRSSR